MKYKSLLTTIVITVVFCSVGFSQFLAPQNIDEQGRVTFEVKAPGAKYVKLIAKTDPNAMGAAEYDFVKADEGKWTVTTNPCRPGLHYYAFNIDGFECSDPWSQVYFGWARWSSMVEVPDPKVDFYLPKEVPHGEVRLHWYHSKTTGTVRKCLIYTPPGYERDTEKRYPVLYLQHGAGESELGWTMQGKVNFILDNLIAEGKAAEMIIVMDNGYAAGAGAENAHRPRGGDNKFTELVLSELVPMIDGDYRTLSNRENRAIAGLSMGAGQATRIGLGNLGVFGSIGAFSGGSRSFDLNTSYGGIFKDPAEANKKIKLLWIGSGYLDRGFESSKKFHQALEQRGVEHVWYEGPGSHEWQVWRRHIHEFAQRLFK